MPQTGGWLKLMTKEINVMQNSASSKNRKECKPRREGGMWASASQKQYEWSIQHQKTMDLEVDLASICKALAEL